MINLDFENVKLNIDAKNIADKVFKEALRVHNINLPCLINVLVCDSEYIRIVNYDMRGINKETDVLSFPNIDFRNFKWDISIIDLETKNVFLGDVLINADRVISQAKLYGHSEEREFAFLLTHSILHLLGYDHMNKKEEKQMFSLQERILSNIGIQR